MAQDKPIGFETVQLFKDQTLGVGSYGKVCKAKCDDLLCAAKLIHETLFDPIAHQQVAPKREHRLPMRRFEQECEFLSTIRHPNIVQYLGIYQDPDTGLPALLMELMDDSLTHFLESSPRPIPYYIQVNICHDITLALSFLHSNDIVHRDLSSNNVLLISNVRAKVTDFGMARLGDQNPQATKLTFTMCPGTDVYMPPEAVQDKPVYTEKIDCFSFGVITLQILTRQFPNPGDRRKEVQIDHPGLPSGMVEIRIPERERRQNHISEINPNHSLLQVALGCLKDRDVERPSSQQLCERVAALKETSQYSESMRIVEVRSTAEECRSDENILEEIDQELRQKDVTIAELRHQVDSNQQVEREKSIIIEEKERELRQKVSEISRLERQLGRVNQELEVIKQVNTQYQRRIAELNQPGPASDTTYTSRSKKQQSSSKAGINLTWRKGEKAPCNISNPYCAAADGSTLYVTKWNQEVYAYTVNTSSWSQLQNTPTYNCPSVIINNLLTLVGGYRRGTLTNQLFSLIGEGNLSGGRWIEEFPPMPTKRWGSAALCTGTALIVAGGWNKAKLRAVEMLNTETLQWSTAADLPQALSFAPAAICGDHIYILGESNMYTCSVFTLIQPHKSFRASLRKRDAGAWKEVAAPPVTLTTCVSIHSQLLAIGGKDSDEKPTTAIHMYDPTTDSWVIISYMATPRRDCIAVILPKNQLIVVGGWTGGVETDSVELATVE